MEKTLKDYQNEIIVSAKRGYPIVLAGAIYFCVLGILSFFIPEKTMSLVWIFGCGVIFPFGIVLGKVLGVDVVTKGNPLGTLGGIVAATQIFFIPVWILIYRLNPVYVPFAMGLLGASHFLPYIWIYRSKAYAYIASATGVISIGVGIFLPGRVYHVLPFAISIVYAIGVLWMMQENKKD